MKVLVTGATGFLGTNLVRELVQEGFEVRAAGLPGSCTRYIEDMDVEIMLGDITVYEDVEKAVDGMDAVFHVAGDTSFWKRLFDRQRRINVDGAVNVAKACLECGVKRLVHTSTVDALGYNPDGLADENWDVYNYGGTGYNYADTKREGELSVLDFAGQGLDVVVINPGSMIGPFDHTLQFGRLFMDMKAGKVPAFLPGGAPWAHVTEVARAQIAALKKGKSGERYITGGVNESYKTVFRLIAGAVGVKPPMFTMPPFLTVAYGWLMEFISEFTKTPPELNPGQARYMSVFPRYDSSRAEKELGFRCVPVEDMIRDAHAWYVENGYLE
jgi:dihydroflavonol-4-reductase